MPWLAWAVSVDLWDSRWPETVQRDVIAAAIPVHRMKGTRGAVIRALAALGVETAITEWWETGDAPYTFRVTARPNIDLINDDTLPILSNELRAQITRMIRVTKPARAHVTLGFLMAIPAHLGMGAVATSSHRRGVWISASVTSRADALLGRASVSAARLHSRRATRAALTAWAEARLGWAAVSGARHHTRLATRSALTARLGAVSGPAERAAVQARILTTLTLEVL